MKWFIVAVALVAATSTLADSCGGLGGERSPGSNREEPACASGYHAEGRITGPSYKCVPNRTAKRFPSKPVCRGSYNASPGYDPGELYFCDRERGR